MERIVEIVKKVPETVRGMFDGLRLSPSANPDAQRDAGERTGPERERAGVEAGVEAAPQRAAGPEKPGPERELTADALEDLRAARTTALVRHAKAVDAIFEVQEMGGKASPEQVTVLNSARDAFEDVRPYGWKDAEAAYKKNPELATEAAGGNVQRTIRALQLETEIRFDPQSHTDRFVDR